MLTLPDTFDKKYGLPDGVFFVDGHGFWWIYHRGGFQGVSMEFAVLVCGRTLSQIIKQARWSIQDMRNYGDI